MAFIDNLRQKLVLDRLTDRVVATMGPPDSGRRIDRNLARELLTAAGYERLDLRDLELYRVPEPGAAPLIAVLDNDMPLYRSTPEDVAMRKSPIVKEMVKIRNIKKILNDTDIRVSMKEETLRRAQADAVARLDLSHTPADLAEIETLGADSLKNGYADGVREALALFSDLTGLRPAPKPLQFAHHDVFAGEAPPIMAPVVLFNLAQNSLSMITAPIRIADGADLERVRAVVAGTAEPDFQGAAVFGELRRRIPPA